MDANWESQQESLIRNAELLPELDGGLKRRVLMEASRSKKKSDFLRRATIAASIGLVITGGTVGISRLLFPPGTTAPIADSPVVEGSDDKLLDSAIDQHKDRAKVFPASVY